MKDLTVKTPPSVIIELTREEALVLARVGSKVGGAPGGPRRVVSDLMDILERHGICWAHAPGADGSIRFPGKGVVTPEFPSMLGEASESFRQYVDKYTYKRPDGRD